MTSTSTPPTQRAVQDQTTATTSQIELLRVFLEKGESIYRKARIHERLLKPDTNPTEKWSAFQQLLVFLWLSSISPKNTRVFPTTMIDKLWHEFILFTRDYQEFCLSAVGEMIHHKPLTSANRASLSIVPRWPKSFAQAQSLVGSLLTLKEEYWVTKDTSAACTRSPIRQVKLKT